MSSMWDNNGGKVAAPLDYARQPSDLAWRRFNWSRSVLSSTRAVFFVKCCTVANPCCVSEDSTACMLVECVLNSCFSSSSMLSLSSMWNCSAANTTCIRLDEKCIKLWNEYNTQCAQSANLELEEHGGLMITQYFVNKNLLVGTLVL